MENTDGIFEYFSQVPLNIWESMFAHAGNFGASSFIFCCKTLLDRFRPYNWKGFLISGAVYGPVARTARIEFKEVKFSEINKVEPRDYQRLGEKLEEICNPICANCISNPVSKHFGTKQFKTGLCRLCDHCYLDECTVKIIKVVGCIKKMLRPVSIEVTPGFLLYILYRTGVEIWRLEGLDEFVLNRDANRLYNFVRKIIRDISDTFSVYFEYKNQLKRKRMECSVDLPRERTTRIKVFSEWKNNCEDDWDLCIFELEGSLQKGLESLHKAKRGRKMRRIGNPSLG